MSKKLLSVVLALALVCSFALSAFAAGGIGYESTEDAARYAQTWALDEPVDNGNGTYSVNVRLTAAYGVGTMQFVVIKNVSAGSLTLTNVALGSDIPAVWLAQPSFNDSTGKVMIIPNPAVDAVPALDCTAGKVIATLTYTASSDVAATLAINVADAKTQTNPAGTLLAARMSDGNVVTGTSIIGQNVNATNTVSIGSGAVATPPQLVAIDGTLGVVDTSRTDLDADFEGTTCDGYVYGFDPEMNSDVSEIVEVIGDGTMEVIPNAEGYTNGSGAMIQVLDLDGNVVAEYVLIVFGDVNCDGAVDSNDASVLELHEGYEYGENGQLVTYLQFAGDVNVDFAADSNDASAIELHENYEFGDNGRLDVAAIVEQLV